MIIVPHIPLLKEGQQNSADLVLCQGCHVDLISVTKLIRYEVGREPDRRAQSDCVSASSDWADDRTSLVLFPQLLL